MRETICSLKNDFCEILNNIFYLQVAKAAFYRKNDPLDAAIFYLAMKKKAVIWGLYR